MLLAISDGTLCDAEGELFFKPCTQAEIDFYQSAQSQYPDFAELMPVYMGTLMLSDAMDTSADCKVTGAITENGAVETAAEQIAATVTEQVSCASTKMPKLDDQWKLNPSRRIDTDKAIVLGNASYGFKHPNILDVKLGIRLWADDAPMEKRRRFDAITSETTHCQLGFRIAGMRVYRGSDDPSQLSHDGYMVYDKDYGRNIVNSENVVEEFRKFIFNQAAGVDEDLGRAVCAAFARDLKRTEDVLTRHESRMYSSSLLFVMEGDGAALRQAIEDNNEMVNTIEDNDEIEDIMVEKQSLPPATRKGDSGIALELEEDDESEEMELSPLPRIYELRLIDFAHAKWAPGEGADENVLTGVRSLRRIFEEMAQ